MCRLGRVRAAIGLVDYRLGTIDDALMKLRSLKRVSRVYGVLYMFVSRKVIMSLWNSWIRIEVEVCRGSRAIDLLGQRGLLVVSVQDVVDAPCGHRVVVGRWQRCYPIETVLLVAVALLSTEKRSSIFQIQCQWPTQRPSYALKVGIAPVVHVILLFSWAELGNEYVAIAGRLELRIERVVLGQ
jgi:hypothetical protein